MVNRVIRILLGVFLLFGAADAFSQTYILAPNPWFTGLDSTGVTIASGKLCTYAAGTTTLLATYSDSSGTANANPITLDSAGRATIYLTSASYKFELRSATATNCTTGTVLRTQDNIISPTALTISGTTNIVAKFNAAGSNVIDSTITDTGSAITLANPTTITTSVTTPLYVGGAAATQALTLKSTSGVGTTDSIVLTGGNNGATTFLTLNTGGVTVNTGPLFGGTAATSSLTLRSTSGVGTTDSIVLSGGNNGLTTFLTLNTGGATSSIGWTVSTITTTSATITNLTSTRVPFASTGGLLADDADMTFATDTLTVTKLTGTTSITDSGLTATRVTFAGTGGLLSDDSDLTFATDTLTATKLIASTSITDSGLTNTRVTVAGAAGLLSDSANLTWSSPALTIGVAGSATGAVKLTGATSGTITITPNATAGTWTLELPAAAGSSGQLVRTTGTAWAYTTATYPATATGTGTILRADGTNWVATTATYPATTTINRILYSSAADTVAEITTANNAVLVTSSTGVPSIAATSANLQVSSSTLDTIQNIQTGSTPQFLRIGFGGAANAGSVLYASGTFSGDDGANGQQWIQTQNTFSPGAGVNFRGVRIRPTVNEAGSGTHAVISFVNVSPGTIGAGAAATTNLVGVDVESIVAATGTDTASGIRVAAPTSATNNYAINAAGTSGGYALFVSAGTSSLAGQIYMTGLTNSNTGDYVCYNTSTNEIEQSATACSLSAEKYKDILGPYEEDALAGVLKMEPIRFMFKKGYGDNLDRDVIAERLNGFAVQDLDVAITRVMGPMPKEQVGFSADKALSVLPRFVVLGPDGKPDNFDYVKYSAVVLTRAMQQLEARVRVLEAK